MKLPRDFLLLLHRYACFGRDFLSYTVRLYVMLCPGTGTSATDVFAANNISNIYTIFIGRSVVHIPPLI